VPSCLVFHAWGMAACEPSLLLLYVVGSSDRCSQAAAAAGPPHCHWPAHNCCLNCAMDARPMITAKPQTESGTDDGRAASSHVG
jgi:hypothetical protein